MADMTPEETRCGFCGAILPNCESRIRAAVQAERETNLQALKEVAEHPPTEDSLTADSAEDDWYKGFLGGWNDALVEAENAIRARGKEEG